ncbi:type II toxin-antitoxin system RelE/ParE family toxin [Geminicoccus roseus]|uniref:type II toxin-antitoxin system RelE/ParE family toxin n=1 Tax=Geminicoccus roseus TaxID=404900 RepID=UPI002AC31B75|nr:type II toxin-antitoxin system RelE/ParE family toxin [Geminicoccus roseus]
MQLGPQGGSVLPYASPPPRSVTITTVAPVPAQGRAVVPDGARASGTGRAATDWLPHRSCAPAWSGGNGGTCPLLFVLHAFEKKTRQTSRRDIDLARARLRAIGG